LAHLIHGRRGVIAARHENPKPQGNPLSVKDAGFFCLHHSGLFKDAEVSRLGTARELTLQICPGFNHPTQNKGL